MSAVLRAFLAAIVLLYSPTLFAAEDPLPSWNDGTAKERIVNFVKVVTDQASKDFVSPAERIAVFDNDGTLWGEKPAYFQLLFAIDRVKALAHEHPEWKTTQPFKAALDGDMEAPFFRLPCIAHGNGLVVSKAPLQSTQSVKRRH